MQSVGFVRGGERNGASTAAAASQPAAATSGVEIFAPKQTKPKAPADALNSNILGIRRVLKQRAAAASGRAVSPDSPPAGRRRASPTYEVFRPRVSPSYEPAAKPRGSPSYEPQPATAAAAAPDAKAAAVEPTASRSRSRSRSRSKSRSRRTSRDVKSSKHRSKHSKRSGSRSRSRSRHHRSSKRKLSRSRSRDRSSGRSPGSRHRHSSRRRHSRSRSRSRGRHSKRSSNRRSRSRSRSRRKYRSRSRSRSRDESPLQFTAYERERARAEERAHAAPMRRGKQGLGFGQHGAAATAALRQEEPVLQRHQDSGRDGRGGVGGSKGGSVSVLDAAAHIPGYASMSAAEKLKARMQLVMAKAEKQGAAAEAADDAGASPPAGVRGEAAWTRFVFDKHGALDEDKLARQQLMDAEVAAGVAGSSAAVSADVEEAGAAFVMGTGRAAARRAATLRTAEEQHDDAIFGRPYGGSSSTIVGGGGGESEAAAAVPLAAEAAGGGEQLAASLGVADGLLSGQQLSWRDRLALKKKKQL